MPIFSRCTAEQEKGLVSCFFQKPRLSFWPFIEAPNPIISAKLIQEPRSIEQHNRPIGIVAGLMFRTLSLLIAS